MSTNTMDQTILKSKKVAELREIAKAFGIKGYQVMKKSELLALLAPAADTATADGAEAPKRKRGRPRKVQPLPDVAEESPSAAPDAAPAAEAAEEFTPNRTETEEPGKAEDRQEEPAFLSSAPDFLMPSSFLQRPYRASHTPASRPEGEKRVYAPTEERPEVEGILEVTEAGYGFLRFTNFLPSDKDVYVSNVQIRRFNLKTGDKIKGIIRKPNPDEKFGAILFIKEINEDEPGIAMRRAPFEELTPVFPSERMVLGGSGSSDLSLRLLDLVAPIGKGQRGLIVAPPKAGKTVLLKKIAAAIEKKHPEVELMVLLVDERPEEVTDIKRSIQSPVLFSTFDEAPQNHVKVAEMVLARAQRLAEHKKDVVILMDSITRLARAYNLMVPPSGKSLSGGLDPSALYKPKKFFGAARKLEEGGSITILATALVETGSRMDEVIFEEFKGTGNMELHLDRKLSEKRIFPALHLNKSGTRREDLLLTPAELEAVQTIRRSMADLGVQEVTETIIDHLSHTVNNEDFVEIINKVGLE
ncbi:MAG: transcription termination factor Rho [Clostridiales bacterium]|nr:transcription termination factor Rho [Clostridiales bacterium]